MFLGGFNVTIPLGIGGAIFGRRLGTEYGFGGMGRFDIRSLTTAIGGALIVLIGYRLVATRVMA